MGSSFSSTDSNLSTRSDIILGKFNKLLSKSKIQEKLKQKEAEGAISRITISKLLLAVKESSSEDEILVDAENYRIKSKSAQNLQPVQPETSHKKRKTKIK